MEIPKKRLSEKRLSGTISGPKGTPYYRIHKSRSSFDRVATMAVEGVDISATARIENLSADTVVRWLESAAEHTHLFNDKMLKGFDSAGDSA